MTAREVVTVRFRDAAGAIVHETTVPRYVPGRSYAAYAGRLQRKLDDLARVHVAAVRVVVDEGSKFPDEFRINARRLTCYVMPSRTAKVST